MLTVTAWTHFCCKQILIRSACVCTLDFLCCLEVTKATIYYYDTRGSFVVSACFRFYNYRARSVFSLYLLHGFFTTASIKNSVAEGEDATHQVMQ
jgi:hypothetical protein